MALAAVFILGVGGMVLYEYDHMLRRRGASLFRRFSRRWKKGSETLYQPFDPSTEKALWTHRGETIWGHLKFYGKFDEVELLPVLVSKREARELGRRHKYAQKLVLEDRRRERQDAEMERLEENWIQR